MFETPLGISRESMGSLVSQTPEETRGVSGLIRSFNAVLVGGGSATLDAAGRVLLAPIAGGIAAVRQAAQESGMSQTDARRLERDLNALAVTLGVVAGAAMGGRPGVPRPERVLAGANVRGMLDTALRDLPREARPAAKQRLREAFAEGQRAGDDTATACRETGTTPKAEATAKAVVAESTSEPPLTNLPSESKAINPMTVEEFETLPRVGKLMQTVSEPCRKVFRRSSGQIRRRARPTHF